MIVLVCGGRGYDNEPFLFGTLDRYHAKYNFTMVVTGDGRSRSPVDGHWRGADQLARQWGENKNIPVRVYKALWKIYGNAAGPIRNQAMLDTEKPKLVIAFPGGKGTANMCTLARKANVPVIEIED